MPANVPSPPPSNITGNPTRRVFSAKILDKYVVDYFECVDTGYIQTEKPYWLAEAYASPITFTDTGILARNLAYVAPAGMMLSSLFGRDGRFLDYAGGYGIFTRLMRDVGLDYYWEDRYTTNVCARGFEYHAELGPVRALTAFEVFEHFADPHTDLAAILRFSRNILFSTLLIPPPPESPETWWYLCKEHGQHVSFHTERSLTHLASINGAELVTNGKDLHLFLARGQIPHRILSRWLKSWQSLQPASIRALLEKAYRFEPHAMGKGGVTQRAKHMVRKLLLPGEFVLRKPERDEGLEELYRTTLARDYATYLIKNGASFWRVLARQLGPLTLADMALLQSRKKSEPAIEPSS